MANPRRTNKTELVLVARTGNKTRVIPTPKKMVLGSATNGGGFWVLIDSLVSEGYTVSLDPEWKPALKVKSWRRDIKWAGQKIATVMITKLADSIRNGPDKQGPGSFDSLPPDKQEAIKEETRSRLRAQGVPEDVIQRAVFKEVAPGVLGVITDTDDDSHDGKLTSLGTIDAKGEPQHFPGYL